VAGREKGVVRASTFANSKAGAASKEKSDRVKGGKEKLCYLEKKPSTRKFIHPNDAFA